MDILAAIAADPNVDPALRSLLGGQPANADTLPFRRAQYVARILRFDHAFEFSDDHTVWRAGVDELTWLRSERKVVDPDGALWLEHMHRDFRHG